MEQTFITFLRLLYVVAVAIILRLAMNGRKQLADSAIAVVLYSQTEPVNFH